MDLELKKLNRFTSLPFLIDLLTRKKLSLLNPALWEDHNDRATLELFLKRSGKSAIYALCLTYQDETIHHWNAFANGTSGCNIEFSPRKLFTVLKSAGVLHNKARYVVIKDLPGNTFATEDLPFLKRKPFRNENEYRLVIVSDKNQAETFDIDIDLNIIRRITLSGKMPKAVFKSTKEALIKLNPELKGKIFHSTLYRNSTWIEHFKGRAG